MYVTCAHVTGPDSSAALRARCTVLNQREANDYSARTGATSLLELPSLAWQARLMKQTLCTECTVGTQKELEQTFTGIMNSGPLVAPLFRTVTDPRSR